MNMAYINIDLTNECNKKCWICHRTKSGEIGDPIFLDFNILEKLAEELPHGVIIYFHYYGEPLLYPMLKEAIELFENQITTIVTNGKLIIEKFDDIVPCLDSLCISVFEKDSEQDEQRILIKEFLERKKDQKPNTIIKLIGDVDLEKYKEFEKRALITYRTLFQKRITGENPLPLMPEYGICSDFLHKPLVNANGDVSICCVYDPEKLGVLGNLHDNSLEELLKGEKRTDWLNSHMQGKREKVPLCSSCKFWGVTS